MTTGWSASSMLSLPEKCELHFCPVYQTVEGVQSEGKDCSGLCFPDSVQSFVFRWLFARPEKRVLNSGSNIVGASSCVIHHRK